MGVFEWMFTLTLFVVIAYLIYRWSIATYDYFERRNVPFVKPYPLVGGLWPFFTGKLHAVEAVSAGYQLFPDCKFSGLFAFRRPGYLIHDPELVKQIAIKDFDHFTDHANNVTLEVDPFLGRSLFFTEGPRWRHGRSGLSPAFTGSKMKNMFALLSSYTDGAMKRLVADAKGGRLEREIKDLFQRMGSDVMTSISFGVEIDSIHDPNNIIFLKGKKFATTTGIQGLKLFIVSLLPAKLLSTFGIRITPRDVADFFENLVSTTIKHREENNIVRPDFIHLMMQARKNELKEDQADAKLSSAGFSTVQEHLQLTTTDPIEWSDLEITAAVASFFFGGIDTTTVLLCFAIYELSLNPDIQKKLREEIDAVRQKHEDQTLSYEVMQNMKYLDMVITETLRRWPPFGITNRRCTKEYTMENSDGTKVVVEKGQLIQISIKSIQLDPKYYSDPMRFDPERFSEENRHQVNQAAFLPFGSGPRNCIGSRLALMQAKCFLYYLLAHFNIEISKRTDVPIQIDNRSISISPKSGFWFHLVPRVK